METREIDDESFFRGSVSTPPDVLSQELPGEELIFLDLRSESYFGLDPVGTRMYRALTETGTVQQAFERLVPQFEIDPATLRRDLRALVERLMKRGILEHRA